MSMKSPENGTIKEAAKRKEPHSSPYMNIGAEDGLYKSINAEPETTAQVPLRALKLRVENSNGDVIDLKYIHDGRIYQAVEILGPINALNADQYKYQEGMNDDQIAKTAENKFEAEGLERHLDAIIGQDYFVAYLPGEGIL